MTTTPQRVLFVCIGNSCRSQMAEGFARCYGRDVMTAFSAGLAPAGIVMPETEATMAEKNISLDGHFTKPIEAFKGAPLDLIVNMSGEVLPASMAAPARDWKVRDPIGENPAVYRKVRDQIEQLVMQLILEIRKTRGEPSRRAREKHSAR